MIFVKAILFGVIVFVLVLLALPIILIRYWYGKFDWKTIRQIYELWWRE